MKKEKSKTINIKVILNIVHKIELKQVIKEIIIIKRLLSKDIIFSVFNKKVRLILKRNSS